MNSSSERPVALVDMDGVLADFDLYVIEQLTRLYPQIQHNPERINHHIIEDYPLDYQYAIETIINNPTFFASLPLVEGALYGWERLLQLGYEPVICSSPLPSNEYSVSGKKEWLNQHLVPHFGNSVVDAAHITRNKHLIEGVMLIDDKPDIRHEESASWKHIIFDRPYNRLGGSALRLYGWADNDMAVTLKSVA